MVEIRKYGVQGCKGWSVTVFDDGGVKNIGVQYSLKTSDIDTKEDYVNIRHYQNELNNLVEGINAIAEKEDIKVKGKVYQYTDKK